MRKDPNERLQHAFEVASTHLNIEKLLDPEDVNTSQLDKKSIMMYVVCYYKQLHGSEINVSSDYKSLRQPESVSHTLHHVLLLTLASAVRNARHRA